MEKRQVLARYDKDLRVPIHLAPAAVDGAFSVAQRPYLVGGPAKVTWLYAAPDAQRPAGFRLSALFTVPSPDLTEPDRIFPVALPPSGDLQQVYFLVDPDSVYRTKLEMKKGPGGARVPGPLGLPSVGEKLKIKKLEDREAIGAVYDPSAGRMLFLLMDSYGNLSAYSMRPLVPDTDEGAAYLESAISASVGHPVDVAVDEQRRGVWILDDMGDLAAYTWREGSYHRIATIDLLRFLYDQEEGITLHLFPWLGGHLAVDPASGALLTTRPETSDLWIIDPGRLQGSTFTPTVSIVHLSQVIPTSEGKPIPVGILPGYGNVLLGAPAPSQILVLPRVNELLQDDSLALSRRFQEALNQEGRTSQIASTWGVRLEGRRFLRFDISIYPDSGGGWVAVDLGEEELEQLRQTGRLSLQGRRQRYEFVKEGRSVHQSDFKQATVQLAAEKRLEVRLTGDPVSPLQLRYWVRSPVSGETLVLTQDVRETDLGPWMGGDHRTWLEMVPQSENAAALFVLRTNLIGEDPQLLEGEVSVEEGVPTFRLNQIRRLAGRDWVGLAADRRSGTVYVWNWDINELVAADQVPTAGAGLEQKLDEAGRRVDADIRRLTAGQRLRWQVAGVARLRNYPLLAVLEWRLKHLLLDPGGVDTEVVIHLLVGTRDPSAVEVDYYGSEEELAHFIELASPRGVRVRPNPVTRQGLEPADFLKQFFANLTGWTEAEVGRRVDLNRLIEDLKLVGSL